MRPPASKIAGGLRSKRAILLGGLTSGALAGVLLLGLLPSRPRPPPPIPSVLVQRSAPSHAGLREQRTDTAVGTRRGVPREARAPREPPPPLEPLVSRYALPPEAASPADVDERRFTEALAQLCNVPADSDVRRWYSGFIVRYAREFGSDPFLLGALMSSRSRCNPAHPLHGVGLTGLSPELYARDISDGRYHFRAFEKDAWVERTISLDRFPFTADFVRAPESNLYFAAAFLKASEAQQRGLAVAFGNDAHRHYVSHFFYGDRVLGNRHEERALSERRRLLEYYGAKKPMPPVIFRGLALGCPLDGCPRFVTSALGDSRAGGTRAHRGVDCESIAGEPVRAIADGKVLFAGADLPGTAHRDLPIYAQRSVAGSLFGAGGIYVCIEHAKEGGRDSVISCYMHLSRAMVEQGRIVSRGDPIGSVGKTGIKESAPHLHFELHTGRTVQDARDVLRGILVGNPRVNPLPDE